MGTILSKVSKAIRVRLTSSSWARKAIVLSSTQVNIRYNNSLIEFLALKLSFPKDTFEFFLDGYSHVLSLKDNLGASFEIKEDKLFVTIGDLYFNVQTAEDLFILTEIYLRKEYNLNIAEPSVVIDIGLNVGFASLYFANRNDIIHVYSYEPFLPTYQQAVYNISLNEELKDKISSHGYGVSDENKELEVEYNYDNKGRVGILGTKLIKDSLKEVSQHKIRLVEISSVLNEVISKHPEAPIIMKIDCEGGEYDIFKHFSQKSLPTQVKGIAMEWHHKGPTDLLKVLSKEGFKTITTYSNDQKVGMIYAIR